MAAPSGTVWGSIVGGYGRIGIYIERTLTPTGASVKVQIWFWSKYSISDSTNSIKYGINPLGAVNETTTTYPAVNIVTSVASGDGWSTSNQVKIRTFIHSFTRDTSNLNYKAKAELLNIDRVGGTMSAYTTVTVPARDLYTVSYNANGGSGAPSSQTKWHGQNLTLSTTKPTRTGYSFQGWATYASGGVSYAAGASYTVNDSVTLYAVWEANTYTVSYNANGGSGAPSKQTKTHGTTLTLSSAKPTRTNYTFKGWGTSASSTTVAYAAGASYTANAAITLYAVWELAYIKPIIHSLTASRCDSAGTETDEGNCGLVKFDWQCTNNVTAITIAWEAKTGSGTKTVTASGTTGSVSEIIGDSALSTDISYTITATVSDSGGSSNAKTTLSGFVFPIDALAGGKGVAFGKPAELEGVADFGLDAKFNKPVYGKALGMDRLPAIPENADFNNYMEPGCYAVYSNDMSETIANIPVKRAGRLEVWSATGEGIRLEQWSYLRQRFIPYNSTNAVWEREITRSSDNVWRYYDWWKSTLTPAASAKVYHEQKVLWGSEQTTGMYMTAGHTATLTEKISEQANGIVLVFCYYNGTADTNWGWITRYVPKQIVSLEPGTGHTFELTNGKFGSVGTKYLYIHDDHIAGHADNNLTGTAGSGITYANNKFVLRYVLGV